MFLWHWSWWASPRSFFVTMMVIITIMSHDHRTVQCRNVCLFKSYQIPKHFFIGAPSMLRDQKMMTRRCKNIESFQNSTELGSELHESIKTQDPFRQTSRKGTFHKSVATCCNCRQKSSSFLALVIKSDHPTVKFESTTLPKVLRLHFRPFKAIWCPALATQDQLQSVPWRPQEIQPLFQDRVKVTKGCEKQLHPKLFDNRCTAKITPLAGTLFGKELSTQMLVAATSCRRLLNANWESATFHSKVPRKNWNKRLRKQICSYSKVQITLPVLFWHFVTQDWNFVKPQVCTPRPCRFFRTHWWEKRKADR